MDPIAAQNAQPRLWRRGELSPQQETTVSREQLANYWLWCESHADDWRGLSDVARRQDRRVRNRECARQSRRANAGRMERLRHDLERERAENERLRAQLDALQCQLAPPPPPEASMSVDEAFNFQTFGVVVDNQGQPMMYIGTEC